MLRTPEYLLGRTALGIERSDAELDSSALGLRDSAVNSFFGEHRFEVGSVTADLGLRMDDHDNWGTEVSPSLSLAIECTDGLLVRAAAGRGFRPPSFTDLYYMDPYNEGNPALKPEESWGGELGVELRFDGGSRASLACFVRDTDNLIDWVRRSTEEAWHAENVGDATFMGAETELMVPLELVEVNAVYRYIDVHADTEGLQSKNARNVARHDFRIGVRTRDWNGFRAGCESRFREVPALNDYWLLSGRISQRIGMVTCFLVGKNLLDENYEEIPGLPTAGVSVDAGVEVSW